MRNLAGCCGTSLPDRQLRPASIGSFFGISSAMTDHDFNPDEDDDIVRAAAARKGSPFLNGAQAAHYLGISLRTLEELQASTEGPPFRRHGRQKRFHIADLDAWSNARKSRNVPNARS